MISGLDGFSIVLKELLARLIILLSDKIEASQNDLFENDVLLTVNGSKLLGSSTTFDRYPASNLIDNIGAMYLESTPPPNTI